MADPSNADDDFPDDDGESGGGESTVSMTSPTIDPSMPLPISVPPPAMTPPHGGLSPMQIPTAPVPFTPSGPMGMAAMPQGRPQAPGPSVPTPFGGLTPGNAPKPLPAAGTPAAPVAGAAPLIPQMPGMPPGMKRPQTVIGLAPPPVGAPRPGAPQGGARGVPLPSGRNNVPAAPRPAAGAAAAAAPLSEKGPPSSGRGVKPPVPASSPKPIAPASSSGRAAHPTGDADSTDQQLAITDHDTPDSQKEDQPTMAKSLGESLALFGLDSGLTDAARAAVVPKPGGTPPQPPVGVRSPLATSLPGNRPQAPPPIPPPPPNIQLTEPLPILHDRTEEEESTRAVSREEMLRGHDAVIMPEDGDDSATGEDATLAVAPGFNEAANSKNLAALAETLQKQGHPGEPPPPSNPMPFDPGFPPGLNQQQPQGGYPQHPQGGYPQQPGYPDPNQQYQQPQYAQSVTPQQQQWPQQHDPYQQQQQPDPYPQQQAWNQQYPGSVGPVSGPHMPAQQPLSQPHFPGAAPQMPQSNPHLQVPQSGHMPTAQGQQMGLPGQPIPFPGQPMMHQPQPQQPQNPFGDWQGNNQGTLVSAKKPFKISGQILLLGAVGLVCLAIFITGIILFATTKF